MSASTAWEADVFGALPDLPTRQPGARPEEGSGSRLRPVETAGAVPARRPRLVYGIIAVAGALAIAGAQLGFSILTTQGTYELKQLTAEQKAVTWEVQMLEEKVAGLNSPQRLAALAADYGMVTGGIPSYMQASTGEITGNRKAAAATSDVSPKKKAAVPNATVKQHAANGKRAGTAAAGAGSAAVVDPARVPTISDGLPTPQTH